MMNFILKILFTATLTYIITSFLGYFFHWMFHQPWSGKFYKSHMAHHLKLYPANDFYSEKYREAGKDNTVILFTISFAPVILLLIYLAVIGYFSTLTFFVILGILLLIAGLNNYLHDQFHLINSWLRKYSWFKTLIDYHITHHKNMSKNYGIFYFFWDKFFGTFLKK